ncbi:MAG: helix-turn-helix domain-containing protein [Planctomycetes bacterium]|nr:helix-turn-helix domain-containing protein [Planctomycetota bacterium]
MATAIETELLSVKQTATLLGLAERTVWRYANSGRLPAPLRLSSRAVRWRRRDLLAWLDKGCPDLSRARMRP